MNIRFLTPMMSLQRATLVLSVATAMILPAVVNGAPESTTPTALRRMADKSAVVPVKAAFEKNASAKTEGPYVLTLTNTSAQALKLTVTVHVSVAVHNRPKTRDVGPRDLAPGQEWKIDDLAAQDKVTVKAEGFEPLKLTVK